MTWLLVLSVFNLGYIAQILLTVVCSFLFYKCAKFMFGKATRKRLLKPVGRLLGRFEAQLDVLSVEKGGTTNTCLMVSLTSKQSLSHQHVRDALVWLVKRQPMLRAIRITTENGDKYFEIKEINEVLSMLDITSSHVKNSDWKDVWFEYTAKQFGNGLLWRVVILQEEFVSVTKDYANTLMFSFNHCLVDGVSCVRFCKQFLNNLNELANGTAVDQEISSLNMLPYFHDIILRTRPWQSLLNFMLTYFGLGPIFRFFMNRSISRQFQTMKCNPYYAQFPPRLDVSNFAGPCRLNAKVFTENETKNILHACKANHCTVTGALAAAANLAFSGLVQDSMKEKEDAKIKWEFYIDAKRRFEPKPHEEYLGFFVYMCDEPSMSYMAGSDVDFWKVARETTKEIQDSLKAERYVTKETMLSHMMKPKENVDLLDRELSTRLSVCNSISSFGSFNFGDDIQRQSYKFKEIFVNSVSNGLPNTVFLHFNYTINGKMSWQITHDPSRIKIQHAEEFANLCFGRFMEIARGRV